MEVSIRKFDNMFDVPFVETILEPESNEIKEPNHKSAHMSESKLYDSNNLAISAIRKDNKVRRSDMSKSIISSINSAKQIVPATNHIENNNEQSTAQAPK